MKAHYPGWTITRSLGDVFREITESWNKRLTEEVPASAGVR
jgi:hypothetical protein